MAQYAHHIVNRMQEQMARLSDQVALRYQVEKEWRDITWQTLSQNVEQLALALLSKGLLVQDKVGIFANNHPRWTMVDLATLFTRGVTVPIYPTSTDDQAAYILNNADVKILFVGEQPQHDAALALLDKCPQLEWIVALSDSVIIADDHRVLSFHDFLALADIVPNRAEYQARLDGVAMDDLLTLIYTSGTTGTPKGVMLDYANFAAQLADHDARLSLDEGDVSLCFLPLSHVFERAWTFYVLHRGGVNCYLANVNDLRPALRDVQPNVMSAVPRVFEKIYAAIQDKVAHAPWQRRQVFNWAIRVGEKMAKCRDLRQKPSWLLQKQYNFANQQVLGKLRHIFGDNIKFLPCGGAKLDPCIGRFFHAIGIHVKLGYGMTETTATISCWEDSWFDPDSIGMAMPSAEVKIGENNEILVKGPMVMRGYYKMPIETAETFTADGFLKTGDAGYVDEHGNLFITDRIKELMKTSGGKYIAPQVIEGKIGKDRFIEQIAVIADTRKYVSALIVPSFESLEIKAKELNIIYQDRLDLLKNHQIIELIEQRVVELQKDLARFERVQKFTLLPHAFSMDKGELTPTQKLRRKVISERYHQEIESMYQEHKPS
jgi:long-chain acyl-CoA synthetase